MNRSKEEYRKSQSIAHFFKIVDGTGVLFLSQIGEDGYSITAAKSKSLLNMALDPDLTMACTQIEFESEFQKALYKVSEINKF